MKIRTLIIATALVSSVLGGGAVYLALTVPNDLRADALLKQSREQLARGNEAAAQEKLTQLVQQYPRTDAAAAATVALVALGDSQRKRLEQRLALAERQNSQQTASITSLASTVKQLAEKPAPAPAPVPAAKPAPAKKAAAKKATPKRTTKKKAPTKRRTTTRRRR